MEEDELYKQDFSVLNYYYCHQLSHKYISFLLILYKDYKLLKIQNF